MVYYVMLSLFARNSNKQIIHSINLQFQNEKLINQLRQEVEQRESLIKSRTKELEIQKQRLELVLKGANLGLWDWNPITNEVVFDDGWANMLGYELSEINFNLETWESRVHPDDLNDCYKDIQAHINGETQYYSNVYRLKHKNGTWRYILDRGQIVERDKENNPIRFTGTHADITGIKETEHQLIKEILAKEEAIAKLNALVNIDPLTKIPNRRGLEKDYDSVVTKASRYHRKMSIVYVDLDFFKTINDELGHDVGDSILELFAKKTSEVLRLNETIYRIGGDEFCILIPEYNELHELEDFSLRLIESTSSITSCDGMKIKLGCSIGIALYPEHGNKLSELISASDHAMYQSKLNSRNSFTFAK